jgi:hypothetical protein
MPIFCAHQIGRLFDCPPYKGKLASERLQSVDPSLKILKSSSSSRHKSAVWAEAPKLGGFSVVLLEVFFPETLLSLRDSGRSFDARVNIALTSPGGLCL